MLVLGIDFLTTAFDTVSELQTLTAVADTLLQANLLASALAVDEVSGTVSYD